MNKEEENNPEDQTPTPEVGIQPNQQDIDDPTPSEQTDDELLKTKLEDAYGKQEHLQGKYLRAVADLENTRKRAIRDREDTANRTRTQIISDLLPVMDAFKLGLMEAEKTDDAKQVVKGFTMAISQFESVLTEYGLVSIEPGDKPFDPKLHDAIGYEDVDNLEDGIVVKTVRCGYMLKDKLIRPATVILSKKIE